MKIKRFVARDLLSVMERVREELGDEAEIISTRALGLSAVEQRQGLRGVEVVARAA
jgi:flagellar biosynthesis GTPase FlhF